MEGLRNALASLMEDVENQEHPLTKNNPAIPTCEDHADALLAPDGPLFPALRAPGKEAEHQAYGRGYPSRTEVHTRAMRWLELRGITGPLADACRAAAEVEL